MKATIFREFSYSPSPVTSICTNNSTTVVFRRNKMVELIDSQSLKQFIKIDIDYEVIQSSYLDCNRVVGLTNCGKIFILDVPTLQKEVIDLNAKNMCTIFNEVAFAPVFYYFSTIKNEIYQMADKKPSFCLRETGSISTILNIKGMLLVGKEDGWIRTYNTSSIDVNSLNNTGMSIISEINVESKVNKICHVSDEKFVTVLENGKLVFIDAGAGIILDSVLVRTSSLNSVVFYDGFVHTSGADSRIICYNISNNKLLRGCQADYHSSEVICMAVDNGHIISAGEDSMVIFNTYFNSRYTSTRLFDESLFYGSTNNYFYVAAHKSINIFSKNDNKLNETIQENNNLVTDDFNNSTNDMSDKITHKISKNILRNINQTESDFDYFLKFNATDKITSISISNNEKYLAYSTKSETKFYNLFQGSKVSIEKIRSFPAAHRIIFTDNYLIMGHYTKTITLFNLSTFSEMSSISYDDFREVLAINRNNLLLLGMKQQYNLSDLSDISCIDIENNVVQAISNIDGTVSMLVIDENDRYKAIDYDNNNIKENNIADKIKDCAKLVSNNIVHDDRIILMSTIKVNDVENKSNIKKYEIGSLIHGVLEYKNELIVLQTSWNYLKSKFKPSVFKNKFSN